MMLIAQSVASPVSKALTESSWEHRVAQEVENIIRSHSEASTKSVEGEQMNVESGWTIPSSLPQGQDRPRPPQQLSQRTDELKDLLDGFQLEDVNAVANQEALAASFASKKAHIQSMLAIPQQAVVARTEQRQMCDHEVKALSDLDGIVGKAIQRGGDISQLRSQQSSHYSDMTNTIRQLTQKNIDTLAQVSDLLKKEIEAEKSINGAVHFDPVALRQQAPEDMLRHADELTGNLLSLMQSKLSHHNEALSKIQKAFACPECEQAAKKLQEAASVVQSDLKAARERCSIQAESHRVLDEADREKVLALKKDLEDIEVEERVHRDAEEKLKEQRQAAEQVARNTLGFLNTLSAKRS